MTGSIICGVDGTRSAARAVGVARELRARMGPRLVFVRVVALGTGEEETTAIAEQLEELSAGDDWSIEVGHSVDRLVAAAADDQVRLLVVGSQGPRSSLQAWKTASDRGTGSAGGILRFDLRGR